MTTEELLNYAETSSLSGIPWCECSRSRTDGFKNIGTKEQQFWVHGVCGMPTKLYWENQVLIKKYQDYLDEIITRIIEKRENPDGMDKGRAEIACLFIGMLLRPHEPNIELVRDDALKRYRSWAKKPQ